MVWTRDIVNVGLPASALALVALDPDKASRILTSLHLQNRIQIPTLRKALIIPVVLSLVKVVNRLLNAWALTNWRSPPTKDWHWPSEVAVVTGGGGGIGKAIVLGLARRGVAVAVLDVADEPADLAALANVSYWQCDIASAPALAAAAAGIRATLGDPSILVNNAATTAHGLPLLGTPRERIRRIFDVNIVAQFATLQEFLPAMVAADKGHVVTVSSMAAYIAAGVSLGYAATKAGLVALHQGLQVEIRNVYKTPGVLSTIVHPMWVETGLTKARAAESEAKRKAMMQPEEVAEKVLDHVFGCRGGQIVLPERVKWLMAIQSFPNWVQEGFRDLAFKLR